MPWDSEPPADWEGMQALLFQYSRVFRPKYLIENSEGKRIFLTAVFKGG